MRFALSRRLRARAGQRGVDLAGPVRFISFRDCLLTPVSKHAHNHGRMNGSPLDDGWYLLTLTCGRKIAGMLRWEEAAGVWRLEVDVPATPEHPSYLAIIAPDSVLRAAPCDPDEAVLMAAALQTGRRMWRPPPHGTSELHPPAASA